LSRQVLNGHFLLNQSIAGFDPQQTSDWQDPLIGWEERPTFRLTCFSKFDILHALPARDIQP
jgi:hypothetical protein